MSVLVFVRFPLDLDVARPIAESGEFDWSVVADATRRAGGRNLHQVSRPGEFVDVDEYPSREAYARFKAEAAPVIDAFERRLGVTIADEVWDVADRRGA